MASTEFVLIDVGGVQLTVPLNVNGNIDLIDDNGDPLELLVQED